MDLLADPVVHSECAADGYFVGRRDSASWPMSNVLSEPLCTDMSVGAQSQQDQTHVDTISTLRCRHKNCTMVYCRSNDRPIVANS